jgi:hypothetical protein
MLEKIKTLYNPTPGMPPEKIGPTVGQNSRYHLTLTLCLETPEIETGLEAE